MAGAGDELVEGEDYYLEEGNMVFTTRFLLERGYCCNSGCRHCPYGDEAKSAQATLGGMTLVMPDSKPKKPG